LIDVKKIAKYYNNCAFTVIKEIDSSRDENDKRYTYLIKFDDGQKLAVKACRNKFTTPERISGWKKICKHYLDLGIYCPQIVSSINGSDSEVAIFDGEVFIIYAEEIKKYKTMEEMDELGLKTAPDIKDKLLESIGLIASLKQELVPWYSPYCVFVKFSEDDVTDENYENAEFFCDTVREKYPQYTEYINKIWDKYIENRTRFEPVYYNLPKAVIQGDLNGTNVLVNDDGEFVGLIDFNLSGTESVLCYIILPIEGCLYNLQCEDLEYLTDKDFLKKCDDVFYNNLKKINKYYNFSEYEKEYFNLCYNTIIPFCCLMIGGMLKWVIREKKDENIENIEKMLDWVYYQLTRDDIRLEKIVIIA